MKEKVLKNTEVALKMIVQKNTEVALKKKDQKNTEVALKKTVRKKIQKWQRRRKLEKYESDTEEESSEK